MMKRLTLLSVVLLLSACGSSATPTPVFGSEIILGTMRDSNWGFLLGYPRQVYLLNSDRSGESSRKALWTSMNKPIWSPNGQWVAFDTRYSYDDDGSSIYISKPDGGQPQRVSYHKDSDYYPSWSPDGTHIVYESNNTEHSEYIEEGIYTLNVTCIRDGTPCNFSPIYISKGSSPAWSPDGKHIAFELECVENYHYCIHVISFNGGGETIQLSPSRLSCYNPQWSPAGAEIIFTCYNQSCCSEEAGIYKAASDGTEFEMVANIPEAWMPQWSPDGSKVAFMSSHSGDLGKMIGWEAGNTDAVYIMNADGTGITRLSLRSDEDVLWFSWLPSSGE